MSGALWLALAAAVFFAAAILWLVRSDRLYARAAAWWLLLDIAAILVLVFHGFLGRLSAALGVSHPAYMGMALLGIVVLLKILCTDIAHTRTQQKLVILVQRVAVLEEKLRR